MLLKERVFFKEKGSPTTKLLSPRFVFVCSSRQKALLGVSLRSQSRLRSLSVLVSMALSTQCETLVQDILLIQEESHLLIIH